MFTFFLWILRDCTVILMRGYSDIDTFRQFCTLFLLWVSTKSLFFVHFSIGTSLAYCTYCLTINRYTFPCPFFLLYWLNRNLGSVDDCYLHHLPLAPKSPRSLARWPARGVLRPFRVEVAGIAQLIVASDYYDRALAAVVEPFLKK